MSRVSIQTCPGTLELRIVMSCVRVSKMSASVSVIPWTVMLAAGWKASAMVTCAPGCGFKVTMPDFIPPLNVP